VHQVNPEGPCNGLLYICNVLEPLALSTMQMHDKPLHGLTVHLVGTVCADLEGFHLLSRCGCSRNALLWFLMYVNSCPVLFTFVTGLLCCIDLK